MKGITTSMVAYTSYKVNSDLYWSLSSGNLKQIAFYDQMAVKSKNNQQVGKLNTVSLILRHYSIINDDDDE